VVLNINPSLISLGGGVINSSPYQPSYLIKGLSYKANLFKKDFNVMNFFLILRLLPGWSHKGA
jgi:hypothetical protein